MTITRAFAEKLITEGRAEPVLGDTTTNQDGQRLQALRRLDLGRVDYYPTYGRVYDESNQTKEQTA